MFLCILKFHLMLHFADNLYQKGSRKLLSFDLRNLVHPGKIFKLFDDRKHYQENY